MHTLGALGLYEEEQRPHGPGATLGLELAAPTGEVFHGGHSAAHVVEGPYPQGEGLVLEAPGCAAVVAKQHLEGLTEKKGEVELDPSDAGGGVAAAQ